MAAESVAAALIAFVQGYLMLGGLFAVPFVLYLVNRVDDGARGSTWGFRLMVAPGAALLWPLLLSRLVRGRRKPVECNAHRLRAAALTASKSPPAGDQ